MIKNFRLFLARLLIGKTPIAMNIHVEPYAPRAGGRNGQELLG